MKISNYLRTPANWLQNGFVETVNGAPISLTVNLETEPPKASKFSLHGAIAWLTPQESQERTGVVERLSGAIQKLTGRNMAIAEFNNSPSTTFADIQKVLRVAGL